ncbi:hypothetical protein [Pedobacter sp. Leaf176]|uniref:hypothetical protein n=1 Tax=Pedobacter sp. Leaf176 TaxID=1736286 RepID=UPI0006FCE354|nr:hypothetical protein [Pedobacter sp. Leaf176]KQR71191.1 hypothetical protein ASF92_07330 [Pedobacter sp. Leaf176]
MKTTQNNEREIINQEKHIDWSIGLHEFNDSEEDVSGGQFGALRAEGDHVVPVQRASGQQTERTAGSSDEPSQSGAK